MARTPKEGILLEDYIFPNELRKEFSGLTVREAFDKLNESFGESLLTFDEYTRSTSLLLGIPTETIIPAADEEPKAQPLVIPTIEKALAGNFVASYDGDSVGVGNGQANCNTLLWLDDDGNIVFEDPDQDTFCRLRINRLMDVLKMYRSDFDQAVHEYVVAGGGITAEPQPLND
jgi:hypothetical protein